VIVAMLPEAGEAEIHGAIAALLDLGFEVHRETGTERTVLACLGQLADALRVGFDPAEIGALPGVAAVHRISAPYRLAARGQRPEGTVVEAHGLVLGSGRLATILQWTGGEMASGALAGAGAVRGQRRRAADADFAGLRKLCDRLGVAAVGEVVAESDLGRVEGQLDVLQASAASVRHNPYFARALAATGRPVLLARGEGESIEDLLLAADVVLSAGNLQVGLLLGANPALADVPRLKRDAHLPVVVDLALAPRDLRDALARAATAAGCDGLVLGG